MVRRKMKIMNFCKEKVLTPYAGVLYHLYEEIFEIDLTNDESRIILYTGERPRIPAGIKGIDVFFRYISEYLVAEEDREEFLRMGNHRFLSSCLESRNIVCLEYREYINRERTNWVQAEIIPLEDHKLLYMVKTISASEYKLFKHMADQMIFRQNNHCPELDETEKNILLASALYEAKTDSLTLLYNQKAMKLMVDSRLDRHRQAAIVFIDLDDFKSINDRYGHMTGDEVLKRAAQGFCDCVDSEDVAGRIGGDEFVLFLSGDQYEDRHEMEMAVSSICQNIWDSMHDSPNPEHLTCSMGVSCYPYDGREYGVLVDKADQALYHAKRKGKNQCVFYREDLR